MYATCIINSKGGSARTTTAVNLAGALAAAGRRVLLVDLDAQGTASLWLGEGGATGHALLEALLESAPLDGLVAATECGVDLAPCGPAFASLDRFAQEEPGSETLLRNALERTERRWDHVIFDCPPGQRLASINSLVAADAAIVPVAAHILSLEPLAQLIQTMLRVRERLNPSLHLAGLLPCRVDQRTKHCSHVIALLREKFGGHVFETEISESVRLAEAPEHHMPVATHDARGKPANEFKRLADEFEERESAPIARRRAEPAAVRPVVA